MPPTLPPPAAVTSERAPSPRVLVFDSGVGGLTVLREVAAALPGAELVYLADTAGFPYGAWDEAALAARVVELLDRAVESERPDVVVVACNTASTVALLPLRARLAVPVVGTVPAVKPAAALSRTRRVAVLATPGTVRRDYTKRLVRDHAGDCEVTLVGAARLAACAERHATGEPVADEELRREIAPAFEPSASGRRVDVIALGCTHYPFLTERLRAVAPWPVLWLDPAPAIARRVRAVLAGAPRTAGDSARSRAFATAPVEPSPTLPALLAEHGLPRVEHRPDLDPAAETPLVARGPVATKRTPATVQLAASS